MPGGYYDATRSAKAVMIRCRRNSISPLPGLAILNRGAGFADLSRVPGWAVLNRRVGLWSVLSTDDATQQWWRGEAE